MDVFYEKLQAHIDGCNGNKRKCTIKNDKYEKILEVLKSENSKQSAKFKFWVRDKFILVQIGLKQFVHTKETNLRVIPHDSIYEKIAECHNTILHPGRDKTWAEIKSRFKGIPVKAVTIFIKMCDLCQVRRRVEKISTAKPIISLGFMTRIQVDLIDMRSVSYGGFNFIMHAKDHFTKFSWLSALPSKEAKNVAEQLRNIFFTFGPPRILQSDNGKEFVAQVILDLKLIWPGLAIINGRPRHPQSQGLVERGNAVVQQMLGKWQEMNKTSDWARGLGAIMLAINTSISQNTQKTPFELVFGQPPRHNQDFWEDIHRQIQTQSTNSDSVVDEDQAASLFNEQENPFEFLTMTEDHLSTSTTALNLLPSTYVEHDHPSENKQISNHKRFRDDAEKVYLRAAERQNATYQQHVKRFKDFDVGHIVGLKIANVDRSNTAPSILPCKIIDLVAGDTTNSMKYRLCTEAGVINGTFMVTDLIDLNDTSSTTLRQIDSSNLPSVSFIQACQRYTHFRSTTACKCTTSCDTARCPCRKRSIPCSTKCHRGKQTNCKNQS